MGLCCSKKRFAKEPGFLAIINPCHQFLHCTHVCSKEKQTLANSKAAHIMKSFAKKIHESFTWSFCKKSKTASPPEVFCNKIPKQLFTLCMKFLQKIQSRFSWMLFVLKSKAKFESLSWRFYKSPKPFSWGFCKVQSISFMKFLQRPSKFLFVSVGGNFAKKGS